MYTELTLTTSNPLDPNPPEEEHGGMVIDVEERDLVVLLAKDEENLRGRIENRYRVVTE